MMKGRVKWFNHDKGYGFVETETLNHILVDCTCVGNGCGIHDLKESEQVLIEVKNTFNKGPQAVWIRRIEGAA